MLTPARRTERLTTAVRDFRRATSTSAFTLRWLGGAPEGIEGGQYDVLDRLTERPAWRMGELAGALRVDPSAVTRAVRPLERLGLVERARDPDDGRAVLVRITAAGRRRHEVARSDGLEMWDEALRHFNDDEIQEFAVLMRRLTGAFEELLYQAPNGEGVDDGGKRTHADPSTAASDLRDVVRRLAAIEQRLPPLEP